MGRQKGHQTLAAVQEMHATRGVLVCIGCAAPRMAEVERRWRRERQHARLQRIYWRRRGKRPPRSRTRRYHTAVQATAARRPPLRPGTGGDVLASAACLSTTDSHVCGAGGHDVSRVFNESTLDRRIHLVQAVPVSQRRQRGNGTGSHGFRSNRARQQTLNEPATFYYNLCIYDVKNEYSCAARAATVRVRFHCVPALPLPLPPEFWANLGYGERERPGRGCPDTVLQRLTLRFWGGMQ